HWVAPPQAPDKEKYINEMKSKYARALIQMERCRVETTRLDQSAKERKTPLSPEEEKLFNERKAAVTKQYQEAHGFVVAIRKQHAANGAQKPAQNGATGQ